MKIFNFSNLTILLMFTLFLGQKNIFAKNISSTKNVEKLEFVIEIFRHGARNALLEDSKGPLTGYGKAQQHTLGQEFRKRYIEDLKFIDDQYNRNQIRIHSSPKKRAFESAKWQLSGLYPFKQKNQNVEQVESYQLLGADQELPPIQVGKNIRKFVNKKGIIYQQSEAIEDIIHPELNENEIDMFYHAYNICPNVLAYQKSLKKDEQYIEKQNENQELWEQVVEIVNNYPSVRNNKSYPFNPKKCNLEKMGKMLDLYACNKFQGVEIEGYTDQMVQQLRRLKEFILIKKFEPDFVRQLAATEHFTEIHEIFNSKFIENKKSIKLDQGKTEIDLEQLKMILYSCHDRNIFILIWDMISKDSIQRLGYEFYVPPFASNLVLEVVSKSDKIQKKNWDQNSLFVKVKLNDVYLEFKGYEGTKGILMQDFLDNILQKNIITDLEQVCGNLQKQENNNEESIPIKQQQQEDSKGEL